MPKEVVIIAIVVDVVAIVYAIIEAGKLHKKIKGSTASSQTPALPNQIEQSSFMAAFNALPETQIDRLTQKVQAVPETEMISYMETFNAMPQADMIFRLNTISETELYNKCGI